MQPVQPDIDPNAGRPQNPYGTVGEPALNQPSPVQAQVSNPAAPTPAAPAIGAPQGPNGMFSVDQTTAASAAEVQAANVQVAQIWDQVRTAQATVDRLQKDPASIANPAQLNDATSNLNTLYTTLSQASQRVETANAAYSTALGKAIDQNLVSPAQIDLAKSQAAKADADAATAKAQAQVLTDGAPGQRALVAAQAGQASASAAAQQATADATRAKTPAEAAQLNAQAAALNAQATQTNTLLPGLVAKQGADISLTQAQAGLTGSQSDLAQAQAGQAQANTSLINAQAAQTTAQTGSLLPAQVAQTQAQAGLAGAQATGQLAQAASTLGGLQQNLLGPMYGLQDKLNAIRAIQQQVFGPGGSGDPAEANDLLNQFATSTIAGTTPYAANVAAANAGLTAFGTQASMYNAAQQALASRANALAGLGGNVLSTLGTMNANAPAGSTAMAGAFQDVMNYALRQQQQAQTFGGGMPQQPTAPQLPALLQRLAPGPTGAPPPAGPGPAGMQPMPNPNPGGPGIGGAQPMPMPVGAATPVPSANPMGAGAPQTSAPVTINIGGGGQPQSSASNPINMAAMPGFGGGGQSTSLPGSLQNYAPPTPDFVHQLWGGELQSGAVRSPYAAMGAS